MATSNTNTDYTVTYSDYHKEPVEYFNINDFVEPINIAEEKERYKNVLDFLIKNKVCEEGE